MKLAFQPTEETEEIIKLRLQLAKNKSKIIKYQQLVNQISQIYQLTSRLIQRLNSNHVVICDLGKILGINEIPYQKNRPVINFEAKDSLSQIISKYSELLSFSEKESEILKLVCLKIEKTELEKEQIKENYQLLQNKHSRCESILSQSQRLSEKVKQLTSENTCKQAELRQLQKINQQLKYEYTLVKNNLQSNQEKMRDLQNQIYEKNIQIQRFIAQLNEEESMTHQKAKIIEKCNKLINSVQLADDEYITHYFRSNGLPLDVQKPLKNKYQLVFE